MRVARLVLVGMCNTAAVSVSVSVSVSALSLLRQLVLAAPGNQQFLSSDTSAATALWEYLVAMWLMLHLQISLICNFGRNWDKIDNRSVPC